MDLREYLTSKTQRVEERLNALVPQKAAAHAILFEAARYSLLSPGKRLRPILALATAEMLGSDVEKALAPACAIELVHTYTLIHDDLPCMDNDDFRRGLPTLHKVYSEDTAVLAGDFLLTHAFEVLAHAPGLSSEQKITLIQILTKSAGGDGLIAGQILDIATENDDVDATQLKNISLMKTGTLFSASLEFGAVVASADAKHRSLLREFGNALGVVFQMVDDILDITASVTKHGKAVSVDAARGKTTFATLLGVDKAQATARGLMESAKRSLTELPCDTAILAAIADYFCDRPY